MRKLRSGKVTSQSYLISYRALDALDHHSVCRLLTLSSAGPILRTSCPGPSHHDHNYDKWRTHCVLGTVCSPCILFHPNNFIRWAQLCTLHHGWASWSWGGWVTYLGFHSRCWFRSSWWSALYPGIPTRAQLVQVTIPVEETGSLFLYYQLFIFECK